MYNFIAIEGCIGAGKSTLTTMLSQYFNCTHQFENFEENPYLENFYKNPTNHAFPLELFFMAERYKQQKSMIESINLFNDKLISDYAFFKSLIFANITLKEDELQLFKMLYNIIYPQLKYPDIVLYLYKDIDKLQENIKKRGRNYESAITNEYLEQLNNEYLNYFKQQNNSTIVILNTNNLDFKTNKEDFNLILDTLNIKFNKKLNYL